MNRLTARFPATGNIPNDMKGKAVFPAAVFCDCGCKLEYGKMQVDHVVVLYRRGSDTFDNMLPACRPCNHRKGTHTVEFFRSEIEAVLVRLNQRSVNYRNAVRFGLLEPKSNFTLKNFGTEKEPHIVVGNAKSKNAIIIGKWKWGVLLNEMC